MKFHLLLFCILCGCTLNGCDYQEPTNISPINNSGKMIHGKLIIGQEHIPFANLSNYAGFQKFKAGELVEADLIDLWTGQSIRLSGKVPAPPSDDPYITLLVELNKTLDLNISWKTNDVSLEDIHFERYLDSFQCIPLVVANHGLRRGYVVLLKQGNDAYSFSRTDYDEQLNSFNYGFLQQGSEASDGILAISYVDGPVLETRCFKLSREFQLTNQGVSAVFLEIEQDCEFAKLHLLENTTQNPRLLAYELKGGNRSLVIHTLQLESQSLDKEIRRNGFRLPDLSLIK